MSDPEDFCEQLSRVKMMAEDDGETWDLSPNDKAALSALLDSHQLHFDRANALEAENRSLAAEVIALMRQRPADPSPVDPQPEDIGLSIDMLDADRTDWRQAALRVGEELASCGPSGYYDFTPRQWLTWALTALKTAPPLHQPEGEPKGAPEPCVLVNGSTQVCAWGTVGCEEFHREMPADPGYQEALHRPVGDWKP